jgi:endonuclease/exonuclease/phosphatase (EEP) superfamily protein YafD
MVAGTALSWLRSPHWFVRGWDFPRVQIALIAAASGTAYALLYSRGEVWEGISLALMAGAVLWQCIRIWPYTPLAPKRVERSGEIRPEEGDACFRLMISNVLMENREHGRLLALVRECRPDVLLVVETDEVWAAALRPLEADFPYRVAQPQDNYYGMMLFSRLPIVRSEVRFLVQDDIPSIHATLRLPNGAEFALHGLHPRPPEPLRDQDSTPRDAELVLVGRAIGDGPSPPTVVAGDLNDVAWSPTTRLFLRLSGLLDPRMGRGLFSSYNANNPLFRFPLDHVFHSNDFRLVKLHRLRKIGSDHFPILIELNHEPDAAVEQPETERAPGDLAEAQEKLGEEAEAARTGDHRPGRE